MAAQTKIIKCVIKLELKIEMLQNLNANETLCIHLIFNMYKYNWFDCNFILELNVLKQNKALTTLDYITQHSSFSRAYVFYVTS